jgi:hypothetical protein
MRISARTRRPDPLGIEARVPSSTYVEHHAEERTGRLELGGGAAASRLGSDTAPSRLVINVGATKSHEPGGDDNAASPASAPPPWSAP